MKRVLITVDHKWRDLPATIFLKKILEKKYGHNVSICRQGFEYEFVSVYRPDIVIFPHILDDQKVKFNNWLTRLGVDLILYPTEGIPSLRRIYEFYSGKFVDMSDVSYQLCWGDGSRRIFLEYKTVPEERLKILGCSRFDFYRPPLNRVIPSKEVFFQAYKLDPALKTILWTTNFTKASIYRVNRSAYLEDFKNYKIDKIFVNPEQIAEREIETQNIITAWLCKAISEIGPVNLIIRPHPMEAPFLYEPIVDRLRSHAARTALIVKDYIWNILNQADVVIQRSCTTGIEAWILQKPVLEMQVNPEDTYYVNEEMDGCSDLITNYDQFTECLKSYCAGKKPSDSQQKVRSEFLQKWAYVIDGRSTLRLADFIDNHLRFRGKPNYSIRNKTILKHLFKRHAYALFGIPYYLPLEKIFKQSEDTDYLGRVEKWVTNEAIDEWNGIIDNAFTDFNWREFI